MKVLATAPLLEPYSNHLIKRGSGSKSGRQPGRPSGSQSWRPSESQSWCQSGSQSEDEPTGGRSVLRRKRIFGTCLGAPFAHLTPENDILGLLADRGSGSTLPTSWASYASLQNFVSPRDPVEFEAPWVSKATLKLSLNIYGQAAFRQMKGLLFNLFSILGFHEGDERTIFRTSLPLKLGFSENLSWLHASHHRLTRGLEWPRDDRLRSGWIWGSGWGWGWGWARASGWLASPSYYLPVLLLGRLVCLAPQSSKIAPRPILVSFLKMWHLLLRIAVNRGNPFSSAPFQQKSAMEALDYRIDVINCGQQGAASLRCKITSLTEDRLSTMFGQRP